MIGRCRNWQKLAGLFEHSTITHPNTNLRSLTLQYQWPNKMAVAAAYGKHLFRCTHVCVGKCKTNITLCVSMWSTTIVGLPLMHRLVLCLWRWCLESTSAPCFQAHRYVVLASPCAAVL